MEFELIDSIGSRELERIREDRNLCAHPSLRMLGDVYEPRPEVARGHLAVALTTLLTHPPTQGRKVLDEFGAYICDPFFVPTHPHMQATFSTGSPPRLARPSSVSPPSMPCWNLILTAAYLPPSTPTGWLLP